MPDVRVLRHGGALPKLGEKTMFESTRQRFRQWREYRRAVTKLYELDDHLLADSGFERRDLKKGVRQVIAGLSRC
jgi:uncharacterized protein YjiS (DUF1127 family)